LKSLNLVKLKSTANRKVFNLSEAAVVLGCVYVVRRPYDTKFGLSDSP